MSQIDAGTGFANYVEMAQIAERGKFDLMFLADAVATRDGALEALSRWPARAPAGTSSLRQHRASPMRSVRSTILAGENGYWGAGPPLLSFPLKRFAQVGGTRQAEAPRLIPGFGDANPCTRHDLTLVALEGYVEGRLFEA